LKFSKAGYRRSGPQLAVLYGSSAPE
jgi:hypothetical protein